MASSLLQGVTIFGQDTGKRYNPRILTFFKLRENLTGLFVPCHFAIFGCSG